MKEWSYRKTLNLLADVDIAVAGGSCTGVFAAVTAARKGAKVAVIESQNRFGGTASASQVCYWHSLRNFSNTRQIIFGLTAEVLARLEKRDAVEYHPGFSPDWYALLNTEELAIELDEMIAEAKVKVFFHHRVVDTILAADRRLGALVVAGKDGLGVIRAKYFIDATGDGDLCRYAGLEMWCNKVLQPPTTCGKFSRWPKIEVPGDLGPMIHQNAQEYHLPEGVVWGCKGCNTDTYMLAGTKIADCNVAYGEDLTASEIEGRRQLRAIQDIIAKSGYPRPVLEALPSLIGARDSLHIKSLGQAKTADLLSGKAFVHAAGVGTYRCDVHSQNPPGTRFRYLDGKEMFLSPYRPPEITRWRPEGGETPEYYTIPLTSMIPAGMDNLIAAGRMIDAENGAFGALRVMVNMNQTGEAAGTTAFAALDGNKTIPSLLD